MLEELDSLDKVYGQVLVNERYELCRDIKIQRHKLITFYENVALKYKDWTGFMQDIYEILDGKCDSKK